MQFSGEWLMDEIAQQRPNMNYGVTCAPTLMGSRSWKVPCLLPLMYGESTNVPIRH